MCVETSYLTALLYRQKLGGFEPQQVANQYAYRRRRGTEMVLAEIMDFIHREMNRGPVVYSLTRLKAIGAGAAGLVGAEEKRYGTEWGRSGARRDRNLAAPSETALRD